LIKKKIAWERREHENVKKKEQEMNPKMNMKKIVHYISKPIKIQTINYKYLIQPSCGILFFGPMILKGMSQAQMNINQCSS